MLILSKDCDQQLGPSVCEDGTIWRQYEEQLLHENAHLMANACALSPGLDSPLKEDALRVLLAIQNESVVRPWIFSAQTKAPKTKQKTRTRTPPRKSWISWLAPVLVRCRRKPSNWKGSTNPYAKTVPEQTGSILKKLNAYYQDVSGKMYLDKEFKSPKDPRLWQRQLEGIFEDFWKY